MIKAPLLKDEKKRLGPHSYYEILDALPDQDFADLTLIASQFCGTLIAFISLVDKNRHLNKTQIEAGKFSNPKFKFSEIDNTTSIKALEHENQKLGVSELGLAIFKRLCEKMRGKIWAESTLSGKISGKLNNKLKKVG